jgi:hypothetical protein
MNAPNELTAIHEAAHCVMQNYFGMEVHELWINEERGNCRFRIPTNGDLGVFEDIAGSLAGKIAEDRLCGFKDEAGRKESGDYKKAFDCAMRLNAQKKVGAELLLEWMEFRTGLFVEKLWPQIQKVAYALLQRGKLSRSEIAEILNGA